MDYGPVDLVLMRQCQSSNMAVQDAAVPSEVEVEVEVEVEQEIST